MRMAKSVLLSPSRRRDVLAAPAAPSTRRSKFARISRARAPCGMSPGDGDSRRKSAGDSFDQLASVDAQPIRQHECVHQVFRWDRAGQFFTGTEAVARTAHTSHRSAKFRALKLNRGYASRIVQ